MSDRRFIRLEIIANGRYCNNDCEFMSSDAKLCRLFGSLGWDRRKKHNGNVRPAACRWAERQQNGEGNGRVDDPSSPHQG